MKKYLNEFIYNLLYPGFVGSMIYELMPQNFGPDFWAVHFTYAICIKILITVFYCLDYVHLYVDMNSKTKDEQRTAIYLICDIASSFSFFFAFVATTLNSFGMAAIFISLLPFWFGLYKRKNRKDAIFFAIYFLVGLAVLASGYFIIANRNWEIFNKMDIFLCYYMGTSLVVYALYILCYNCTRKSKSRNYSYHEIYHIG